MRTSVTVNMAVFSVTLANHVDKLVIVKPQTVSHSTIFITDRTSVQVYEFIHTSSSVFKINNRVKSSAWHLGATTDSHRFRVSSVNSVM